MAGSICKGWADEHFLGWNLLSVFIFCTYVDVFFAFQVITAGNLAQKVDVALEMSPVWWNG